MTRPDDQNLDDTKIRRLLRAAPEPALSVEQRTRLRARIGLEGAEGNARGWTHDQTKPDLALIETADDITSSTHAPSMRHRTRVLITMAAVIFLVLGSAVTLGSVVSGRDSVRVSSGEPSETANGADASGGDAGAAQFCGLHGTTLDNAVATWDGVDNWSYLTDRRLPAPDLVDAAVESLGTLQDLQPTAEVESALAELKSLRADGRVGPSTDPPYEWSSAERAAQVDALNNAIETIDAIIIRFGWEEFDGCE